MFTPRTTDKILRAFLYSKGIRDEDIGEVYTPFGYSDYQTFVANIKKFATGGKTAVISTINGDSNVPFYKELPNLGIKAIDVPVIAFSVGGRRAARHRHQTAGGRSGGLELLRVAGQPIQ